MSTKTLNQIYLSISLSLSFTQSLPIYAYINIFPLYLSISPHTQTPMYMRVSFQQQIVKSGNVKLWQSKANRIFVDSIYRFVKINYFPMKQLSKLYKQQSIGERSGTPAGSSISILLCVIFVILSRFFHTSGCFNYFCKPLHHLDGSKQEKY